MAALHRKFIERNESIPKNVARSHSDSKGNDSFVSSTSRRSQRTISILRESKNQRDVRKKKKRVVEKKRRRGEENEEKNVPVAAADFAVAAKAVA